MTPPTSLKEPPPTDAKTTPQTRVVQLPISQSEWAALQAPFPLTEEKWEQMLDVLNAMKPALVSKEGRPDGARYRDSANGAEGSD